MSDAYSNISHIINQIKILEDLYHKSSKQLSIIGLGTKNSEPLTYTESLTHIKSFLKMLNEESLTQSESDLDTLIDTQFHLTRSLEPRDNKLQFDDVIVLYINWISKISNISDKETNNSSSGKLEHILGRIRLLEKFYEEACIICSDDIVVDVCIIYSEEIQTYSQIMTKIENYLKFLSGQEVIDPTNKLLLSLSPNYDFGSITEPYITWIYTVLNQCRNNSK